MWYRLSLSITQFVIFTKCTLWNELGVLLGHFTCNKKGKISTLLTLNVSMDGSKGIESFTMVINKSMSSVFISRWELLNEKEWDVG